MLRYDKNKQEHLMHQNKNNVDNLEREKEPEQLFGLVNNEEGG